MNTLSYQKCYEILELQNHAKWDEANTSFRQLVQKWHPDRYDGDEPEDATRHYVEITKAFKKLREFHKENGAMPFSSVEALKKPDIDKPDSNSAERTNTGQNKTTTTATTEKEFNGNRAQDSQSEEIRSVGTSDRAISSRTTREKFRPSRFAISVAAVMVVGISMLLLFMTKLDSINNEHYRDEARLQRISEQVAEQPGNYQ